MTDKAKSSTEHKTSFLVISGSFVCLGMMLGVWGAIVPLLSEKLSLEPLDISLFLLLVGVSLVISTLFLNKLISRTSSKTVVQLTLPVYMLTFICIVLAPDKLLFYIWGACFGLNCGLLDGAINIQAVEWERTAKKNRLSTFHGMYTLGVMAGAGYWLIASLYNLTPLQALPPLFILLTLPFLLVSKKLLNDHDISHDADQTSLIGKVPISLILFFGLLIFLSTTVEGGITDWSALFLHHDMGLMEQHAGIGVALFFACMSLGRFCGDWLILHIGYKRLLAIPIGIASLSLILALTTNNLTITLMSFALSGFAIANVFPVLLRAFSSNLAKEARVKAVAKFIGFAYFGVISGPVILGIVAHYYSYTASILAIALMLAIVSIGTVFLSSKKQRGALTKM